MHQTKGQIEIFTRAEHAVMRPDGYIIFFHQFTGCHCDIPSARYHPANNSDAVREYDRALRCHLPEFSCKYLILQWKHEGQGNGVGRVSVIDHSVSAVCELFFHLMVHQMGWQLAGWSSTIYQAPADLEFLTLVIHTDDADIGCWI